MSLSIKVCGMTSVNQVETVQQIGADFIGLIFYSQSPRYVLNNISEASALKDLKLNIPKVGVFVNESLNEVVNLSAEWKLDFVQLHGEESPEYCAALGAKVPVIKAFRIGDAIDPLMITKGYDQVDHFLFDTLGKKYGGTGEKFKWDQLLVPLQKPYFLSGGIGPDDVAAIGNFKEKSSRLFAIDINSKFEDHPGTKNIGRLTSFIEQVKKQSK